jgi:hypothetical protein
MGRRPGRGAAARALVASGLIVVVGGCATWQIRPTMPGPGVPVIANLRIEPERAAVGQEVTLIFEFEDSDADVIEAHIYPSEVRDWVFTQTLAATVLDLKRSKYGQAVGVVETRFTWDTEGVRLFEVFVVDEQGHTSNKLRARVTVRRP